MPVILSNDADFRQILTSNDKILVKFYADWCGSCKLLAPKFEAMSNEADKTDITFVKINAEENPEIRKAAGVSNLPFFAYFEAKALKASGSMSKEDAIRSLIQ